MKEHLRISLFCLALVFAFRVSGSTLKDSSLQMQNSADFGDEGHDDIRFNYMMEASTNPFNFLWKQFPLAIEYITPKYGHEVRFNYFSYSSRLVYDFDKNNFTYIRSTGLEMSYTFKWFVLRHGLDNRFHPYHGLQVRYSYRTWEPYSSEIRSKADASHFTDVIHSHSEFYDLCYVYGKQFRHKALFLDAYAGAGIGYRTLLANYDYSRYFITNSPFIYKNWNSFYPAIRLGIRIGLVD